MLYPEAALAVLPEKTRIVLQQLHIQQVELVIIGGYAMRVYGNIRPTKDLDLFLNRSEDNVRKLCRAFQSMGPKLNLDTIYAHLIKDRSQLAWVGVDIFTSLNQFQFEEVFSESCQVHWNNMQLSVISLEHLKITKEMTIKNPLRKRVDIDKGDLVFIQKLLATNS
jgi:hypothetical protein